MSNLNYKVMVLITGIEQKENAKNGEKYIVLVLHGKSEVMMSKTTGKFYVTCRKASLPCTLAGEQARSLIGQTLPGTIEKVACTPFEVKLPNGKKAKISHTFQYSPEPVAHGEVIQ
jgi:hypothetical protein